jgi:hypothetical protein
MKRLIFVILLMPVILTYGQEKNLDTVKIVASNWFHYVEKDYIISLYNILGKCVLTQPVQGKMQINLKNKGIKDELLFYRMIDEKRILKTGKFCLSLKCCNFT